MKFYPTLKGVLTVRFVLAALVPVLAVGAATVAILTWRMEREVSEKNFILATSVAGEVERFLAESRPLLAQVGEVIDKGFLVSRDEVDEYLQTVNAYHMFFNAIQVLDKKGIVRHMTPYNKDDVGLDLSMQPFFKESHMARQYYWSAPFLSIDTGQPTLVLARSLERGMLVGYLNLGALNAVIDRVKIGGNGYAAIVDGDGTVLAHPDRSLVLERVNLRNLAMIKDGLEGREGTYRYRWKDVDTLGSVALVQETGWLVFISQPFDEAMAPLNQVKTIVWAGTGLAAFLALVLAFLSIRKTLAPLARLVAGAQDIAKGNFRWEPPKRSYVEIDRLAEAIKVMSEAIDARETGLRMSEERYRILVEESFDGIFIQRGVKIVFANRRLHEMLGYEDEELLGKDHWIIYHPEYRELTRQRALARLRGEEVTSRYEVKLQRKDGAYLYGEIEAKAIRVGDAPGIQVWVKDISERRLAEQELRQSEMRFRNLFNSVTDVIFTQDLEGRFLTVNRAMGDLFGYEPQEFIGKRVADFMKPELRPYFDSEYLARLKDQGHYEGTSSFYAKDGRKIYMEFRCTLVRPDDGEPYISGISRDVTDHVTADRALREKEERIRSILQASPNPLVVYDPEGTPLLLNPAFTSVFGWTLDELKGKQIPFVPDDQREPTMAKIKALYRGESPGTLETRRVTKDGRILDILINAAVVRDPHGRATGMVVSLTDVTEKKKMEAALQRAQKMEAIGTLAGGVAHDFNNLLMAIQGNISLMLLDIESDRSLAERLKNIEEAVQRGADLTRQLLGFARGGKYEVKPTDLNELIRSEIRMFARAHKEIKIIESYAPGLWPVACDRGQMAQVLLNIWINAAQAMPDGGELRIITANETLAEGGPKPVGMASGRYVKVSVSDTGTGMDEATRQRIFEPFFTTKKRGRGTGLGLASAYGIVKNHGGFIYVKSERGQGATFDIYLPAMEEGTAPSVEDRKEEPEIMRGEETILLVDDEEMILEIGKESLEKLGYHVLKATSGVEAIDVYMKNKERIAIVILDMIMPDMGGGEVYDRLKQINGNIKVLLSSGYSINGQASDILKRGCNGFIQKPFDLKQLSHKLREILDKGGPC